MKERNAINFLLYSYFAVTLDSEDAQLIDAAICRAYRDASSRVLTISSDADKFNLKQDAIIVFKDPKMQEHRSTPKEAYDAWFYNVCNKLKEIYKDWKLKFGHAQKWVNMTMKYLYVLKTIFKKYGEDRLSQLPDELEAYLHIPADGYIMEAIKYYPSRSWSKWELEDYNDFRQKADEKREGKSPLDWEGPEWIAVADRRRKKDFNRQKENFEKEKKKTSGA